MPTQPSHFQLHVGGRGGDAQEDQNSTIQPHQIFVSKAGDTRADLGPRNGRDLIYHQSADSAQAVALARLRSAAETEEHPLDRRQEPRPESSLRTS